jgi:capsule polysaccharide export protein KpsE/RkpR
MKRERMVKHVISVVVVLIFGVLAAGSFDSSSSTASSSSSSYSSKANGDSVTLQSAFLGTTQENEKEIVKYAVRKDQQSIMDLIYNGKAFAVESGTNATIMGSSFDMYQVRITSGSQSGKTGWLPKEFVH